LWNNLRTEIKKNAISAVFLMAQLDDFSLVAQYSALQAHYFLFICTLVFKDMLTQTTVSDPPQKKST